MNWDARKWKHWKWLAVDKDVRWSYGIFTFCYVFPYFNFMSKRVRNRVQTPHFEWRTQTHLPFGVLIQCTRYTGHFCFHTGCPVYREWLSGIIPVPPGVWYIASNFLLNRKFPADFRCNVKNYSYGNVYRAEYYKSITEEATLRFQEAITVIEI